MGVADGIKNWIIGIALKKALQNLIKVAVSFVLSAGVVSVLGQYGINIEVNQTALEGGLTALIASLLEMVRNFIKTKYPAIGKYL